MRLFAICTIFLISSAVFPQQYARLYLQAEGIYRLSGQELSAAGIDINSINPQTLRLFSDGQKQLPYSTTEPVPQLQEVAIRVEDGGDGEFDDADYLLFYGQSLNRLQWDDTASDYIFLTHPYDTRACYWLSWNGPAGLRIQSHDGTPVSNVPLRESYINKVRLEQDNFNPMKSGLNWSYNLFASLQERFEIPFDLPELLGSSGNMTLRTLLFNRYFYPSNWSAQADIEVNGFAAGTVILNGARVISAAVQLNTATNTLALNYSATDELPRTGVDYAEISYLRTTGLSAANKKVVFAPAQGDFRTRYRASFSDAIEIFDISNPYAVTEIVSSDSALFEDSQNSAPQEYWLNKAGDYLQVEEVSIATRGWVASHNASYIAIVPAAMEAELQPLLGHRQTYNGFATLAITVESIFDEFGFGRREPVAIRNAVRWMQQNWTPGPRFILLAGNGYYDYRNITGEYPDNWIPTFQISGNTDIDSRETDDFYTDTEFVLTNATSGIPAGTVITGSRGMHKLEEDLHIVDNFNNIVPDIAIGRFPADTPDELAVMVAKTIAAETAFDPGLWRLNALLVADDEGSGGQSGEFFFLRQIEFLATDRVAAGTRLFKLYETEYPFAGSEKPAATRQLINWINQGNRIVSFNGHAADSQWTHENLLNVSRDPTSIKNNSRNSLFLGYSQLYKFDEHQPGIQNSLLKRSNEGFWAVLVPTRPVFAFSNERYHSNLWEHLQSGFLGEAVIQAKLGGANDQKYRLLGDPAMQVRLPEETIQITSISPDTLKAFSLAQIAGSVSNAQPGDSLLVEMRAPGEMRSSGNVDYEGTAPAIYRGLAPINNGTFQLQFVVPGDINQNEVVPGGRLFAYTWNGSREGRGFVDSILVGGLESGVNDLTPPQMSLQFAGDTSGVNAFLVAGLFDENGINLSALGNRQPLLFFDGNRQDSLFVGEFFQYDEGSFQSGTLRYPLPYLSDGSHSLTLQVHDNYGNMASDSLFFDLTGIAGLPQQIPDQVELAVNYPNPFNPSTTILFSLSGNTAYQVRLEVFNLLGQRVRTLLNERMAPGVYQPVWDGRNEAGKSVASGVYIYRLQASSVRAAGAGNGGIYQRSQKMLLIK